jgi:TonB family protein
MFAGVFAAILIQAVPTVPAAVASDEVVTRPVWTSRPSGRNFAENYPVSAQKEELAGSGTIRCVVTAAGTLGNCEVTWQEPENGPFGATALSMARYFKMEAKDAEGALVAGRQVRIPLRFILPRSVTATPVRVKSPSFAGSQVDVDCRFRDRRLDNCLTLNARDERLREAALAITKEIVLPPTREATGRVLLPLQFVGE